MSSTYRLFSPEVLDEFVAMLKEWPNSYYEIDEAEYTVGPFITFYLSNEPEKSHDVSIAMIEAHEKFERLQGGPYKVQTHPDSERPHSYGSKRLGDLRSWARKTPSSESFVFNFTNEKNHRSSPTNAGYFWRSGSSWDGAIDYSSIQFYYRWQWWLDNRTTWRSFVHEVIEKVRPEQVYSGFAMANPLEFGARSEVTVWDRALTPHFYGLDTDYPFGMHLTPDLPSGLRPPTWGFLLSDIWREKISLSRQDVRAALADPRIRIDDLNCGQWIELGPQPELYPVENGLPELPALLNRLLRPLRHTRLDLLGFGEWDGDPNVRFSRRDSERWLARFDDDSDWPSPEARGLPPDAPGQEPLPTHASGGEACPRTGWWVTAARHGLRQRFEHGESLPVVENDNTRGVTLWQWDVDQRDAQSASLTETPREAQSLQPAPRAGLWMRADHPLDRCRVQESEVLPLIDGLAVTWQWVDLPPHAMRITSGQPCPYPGVWYCEDIPVGPRTFMHGVTMPQVQGRDVTWFLASTS